MKWVILLHCVELKTGSDELWWTNMKGREAERRSDCDIILQPCLCDLMKTHSRQLAVMLLHSGVPLFKSEGADLATNQSSKPNMRAVIYGASAQLCEI